GAPGPSGEPGPSGAPGADSVVPGPTGPAGPAGGLSSVHVATGTTAGVTRTAATLGEKRTATATCSTGTIVSGGGLINPNGGNDRHNAARPQPAPDAAPTAAR